MNVKVQNQAMIPPHPPFSKGGWGDLKFGFGILVCLRIIF
jgi:hypothetical protein